MRGGEGIEAGVRTKKVRDGGDQFTGGGTL